MMYPQTICNGCAKKHPSTQVFKLTKQIMAMGEWKNKTVEHCIQCYMDEIYPKRRFE